MTQTGSERDLERFRSVVSRLLGLHFDEARLSSLSEALERRIEATRESRTAYLERIAGSNPPREELRALAQELTVGETYFFRNMEQFRAFADIARPLSRVRVLSAGCATGEEPYSVAMIARDLVEQDGGTITITGVDVNPAALAKASRAIYSNWALRETPGDMKRRWFADRGNDHALAPSIRTMVRFEERNLAEEEPGVWQPGSYDVVFCRNVLMYLTPERARLLVARIRAALAPGGHLFLGSAETLRGLSHGFHLRHTHGTFYYQRRDEAEPGRDEAVLDGPGGDASVVPAPDEVWREGWIETVRRSSTRIHELSERSRGSAAPALGAPRTVAAADLARAMELLKTERFADALRVLGEASEDLPSDPDVLLLRAVLLTLSGRLDDAETACNHLCQLDDLSAGAHYLLALCREGAGDAEGAAEHDRAAAYLDPAFAMPRLHLGLLARRAGDLRSARREIEQALELLVREDPSRILLFGGGFTREALAQLCRAELRAIGDPR